MKIYKFTKLLAIPLLAVSCQKAADTSSTSSADMSSLSSSACESGSSGVALEDAKILGADNIVANQKVNLSLESSVNCAQAQKAQWSISNMVIGQGSQIETTVNGSGVYYINVNSKAASSGAQPQTLASSKAIITSTSATTLRVAVTNSEVLLVGPSVGVEFNSNEFSLVVPNGVSLQNASWNFGTGSIVNSLGPVSRSFNVGTHTINVELLDSNNVIKTL
jgi:hypothetical protein